MCHRDDVTFMVHVIKFDVFSYLNKVREIKSLFCYSYELVVGVLIGDFLGVVLVQYLHFGFFMYFDVIKSINKL